MEHQSTLRSSLVRWLDWILTVAVALAALITAVILVSVVIAVLSRQFFGRPMVWVVDLSGPGLLYVTFLAAAYVARQDGHTRLSLIDNLLSPRALRTLGRLADVVCLLACGFLLYATTHQTLGDLRTGQSISGFSAVERWKILIILPIGSGLLVLHYLRQLVLPDPPSDVPTS